ncbi:hypothetical protein BJ165DRAFT_602780 [Panaeolus papilionaceus]|nr:hypothetical protein BJ165DRAFT_602780 [Panaeolus papilionaceus]
MSIPANPVAEEDINVFWDFETTRGGGLSSSVSTYDLVKNLRTALRPYGKLKSVRAYWDFSGQLMASASSARSDLSSSGVTLIDCPASGRKDLATKMMLVDIFIHALDHSPPHTFAIMTGDRDLAYGISTLRLRDYRVIVVSPVGIPELTAQASVHLDWTSSILGLSPSNGLASSTIPFTAPSQAATSAFNMPTLTSGFAPQRPKAASDAAQTHAPLKSVDAHQLGEAAEIGRGRQGSMFSKPTETGDSYSMYGDLGNLFATPPPKSRPAPFGNVGDSNIFSGTRSNSRGPPPSRGDSGGFAFSRPVGASPQVPAPAFWGTSTPSLKSKRRDFPVTELDDVLPTSRSLAFDIPAPTSTFAPFDEAPSSWEPRKDKGKAKSTSLDDTMLPKTTSSSTNSSSSSSRGSSTFSFVEKPATSTARTSLAEPINDPDAKPVSMPLPKLEEPVQESERAPTPLIPDVPVVHSPEFPEVKSLEEKEPASGTKPLQATAKPFVPPSMPVPSVLPSGTSVATAPAFPQPRPVQTPDATPALPSAPAPAPALAVIKPVFAGTSTAIARPSTQPQTQATPAALPVPVKFRTLVDVLRKHGGRTTKSTLGAALTKANHRVYQLAGVSKFGHYISAAIDANIIQEVSDRESVSLRAEYR